MKCMCSKDCKVEVVSKTARYAKGHNPACHAHKHTKEYARMMADRNRDPVFKKKCRKALAKLYQDPEYRAGIIERMTKRNKSRKMRRAVSRALKKYISTHREEYRARVRKSRKKFSATMREKWASDRMFKARRELFAIRNGERMREGFASGELTIPPHKITHVVCAKAGGTVLCRGSWERAFVRALELSSRVVKFAYEPVRLPYLDEDEISRTFAPDYLARMRDGGKLLIEVKGYELYVIPKRVELKNKAAENYCTRKRYRYVFLGGRDAMVSFAKTILKVRIHEDGSVSNYKKVRVKNCA